MLEVSVGSGYREVFGEYFGSDGTEPIAMNCLVYKASADGERCELGEVAVMSIIVRNDEVGVHIV